MGKSRDSAPLRGRARLERLVFLGASALIALDAIVESFVSLRPGGTREYHLWAVLVPLVIVVLAAWLYPHMRPGLRAATSALFGVLALAWGVFAVLLAAREGFVFGRLTGFLLLPAGIGLLVLSARIFWYSRKPGRFRYLRLALYLVAGLLAAYWVMVPIGLAGYATHRPSVVVASPSGFPAHEEVVLESNDGVDLHAWYIPSRNGAAVITFPLETSVRHAALLAEHGYGVLLLDPRGYGRSEGEPNAYGWGWTRDIDTAVAYVAGRGDVRRADIGGLGLSVGGEQMIEAAADNADLKAVVAEGVGERSVRETLVRGPRGYLAVPTMAVQTAALAVLTGDAPPRSLERLAPLIAPRPLLLIHAEYGGGGEELTPDYFAAAGAPKDIWLVPGAGHIDGIGAARAEYEQRLITFFDAALLHE